MRSWVGLGPSKIPEVALALTKPFTQPTAVEQQFVDAEGMRTHGNQLDENIVSEEDLM
jgi:hypothetical protein